MAANLEILKKLYRGVIEDTVSAVHESFNDDGVDYSVLLELKQLWENKLAASKVLEPVPDTAETNMCNQLTRAQQSAPLASTTTSQPTAPLASRTTSQPSAPGGPSRAPTNASATPAAAASAGKMIKIQITVPAKPGSDISTAKSIAVLVPAHALQGGNAGAQLRQVLSSASVTAALALPADVATRVLQQHINTALNSAAAPTSSGTSNGVTQVDGPDDSEEEDVDSDEDDEDDQEIEMREEEEEEVNDEDPLNSEDDLTDEDPADLFETDNVVVCQYEKIARTQNRWKFQFKDGIMNINGRDYVFQRENGDAEW